MKKRVLSMLLAIVTVLTLLPVMGGGNVADAAETAEKAPLKLISQNFQASMQMKNDKETAKAFKERLNTNVQNILKYLIKDNGSAPDIITMQEIKNVSIDKFKELFATDPDYKDYKIIYSYFGGCRYYIGQTGDPNWPWQYYKTDKDAYEDGANPIIYNSKTVELVEGSENHFWLTKDEKYGECFGDGWQWYRGVSYAKFRIIGENKSDKGKVFYVFSTHFPLVSKAIEGNDVYEVALTKEGRKPTKEKTFDSVKKFKDQWRNNSYSYFGYLKNSENPKVGGRLWGIRGDGKPENTNQLECIKKLYSKVKTLCIDKGIPYFMMGDFNIKRDVEEPYDVITSWASDMAKVALDNGAASKEEYNKTTCGNVVCDFCFGNAKLTNAVNYKVLDTKGHREEKQKHGVYSDHDGVSFEVTLKTKPCAHTKHNTSGKCTVCGKTGISHTWNSSTGKCKVCSKVCSHKYGSWTTSKAATCNNKGTQKRVCSVCKAAETKTIPAKGMMIDFGYNGHTYTDPAYGKCDFAKASYWFSPKTKENTTKQVTVAVTGGNRLSLKTAATKNDKNSQYIETSTGATKLVRPLSYKPKAGDIIKIRYRLTYDKNNANNKDNNPTITAYGWFGADGYKGTSATLNTEGATATTQTPWRFVEMKVTDAMTKSNMSSLRLTFRNFCNSSMVIHYIYVGPAASAPTYR